MTPTVGQDDPPRPTPRIRASARRAVAHAASIVRLEKELVQAELEHKSVSLGAGAGAAVAAGVFLLFAVGFGLATVVAVLALVVPWWLALLIVFSMLVLVVLVLVLVSRSLFRDGTPLAPKQAIAEARLTKQILRGPHAG